MADIIRINSNTWRIEDGFVRMFLLAGSERALLVDTGATCPQARTLAESLTELPVVLLNTHADPDHVSGNAAFEEFLMHPADEPFYRQIESSGMLGQDAKDHPRRVVPVADGDVIDLGGRPLEIIHIPGHTPGSVAILDEGARVLISGDSVQTGDVYMFGPKRSVADFAESLARLDAITDRFDVIYPSHDAPEAAPDLTGKLLAAAKAVAGGEIQQGLKDAGGEIEQGLNAAGLARAADLTETVSFCTSAGPCSCRKVNMHGTDVLLAKFEFAGLLLDLDL